MTTYNINFIGPWTNNCVGHFNYGHFIRFIFWVDVACTFHFILLIKRTAVIIQDMSHYRVKLLKKFLLRFLDLYKWFIFNLLISSLHEFTRLTNPKQQKQYF